VKLRLSVVDQAPVRKGGTAADALRESLALAERTDALGYERYWVAEHHSLPSIASTSPEILIGLIAARTRSIRVGSGGVMLTHYSAFKVAENFRMLESLFPGRIDLGLGRAPGSDQRTAAALAYPGPMRDVRLPDRSTTCRFLADELPEGTASRLHASPTPGGMPEVWLLGSGSTRRCSRPSAGCRSASRTSSAPTRATGRRSSPPTASTSSPRAGAPSRGCTSA
jgi:luciferase family oxidoreductase group 1